MKPIKINILAVSEFTVWLDDELNARSWSRADLARRSGIGESTLSMIYSDQRQPYKKTLIAISKGLDLPVEEVFRAAGLLPPEPVMTEELKRAVFYLSQLDAEDRHRVILYLEVLYTQYAYGGKRP